MIAAQIQFMLHQHQVRHYQQRALDTYVSEPFRALDWQLQGMTQTGSKTYGTGAEWTLVVERVRAIPKFLAAAQDQLRSGVSARNTPDPRMLRRDGIETAEANAKYFEQTLPQIAADRVSGDQRGQILGEINDASKQAMLAYESSAADRGRTALHDMRVATRHPTPRSGARRRHLCLRPRRATITLVSKRDHRQGRRADAGSARPPRDCG